MKAKNFILIALMILSSSGLWASDLTFKQCSLDASPAYHPLWHIDFTYHELLSLNDSTAKVYQGEKVVAEGKLVVNNYHGHDSSNDPSTQQGTIEVTFDEALVLPKGETFTVVIPKGSFAKESDPNVVNDEISYSFTIPTDLGDAWVTFWNRLEDGTILSNADFLTFFWATETESNGEQQAILYREGVPVRQFPFNADWDWDMGQARIDFGGEMKFEKGVNFALEIPEGTVYAMSRPDITNKRAVFHFVGGYEEPLPSINYVWCSLNSNRPTDVLDEVVFHYDQAVMLSSNHKVQLWYADESEIVKEVTPTLTEEDGKWILKADFDDTPITSPKGYTIIIPDGTLISVSGDVVVNSRKAVDVNETSGITNSVAECANVASVTGGISISGLHPNTPVTVYRLDGTVLSKTFSDKSYLFVPAIKGSYIVQIGNMQGKKVHVAR